MPRRWRVTEHGREPRDPRMQQICARLRAGATYEDIAAEFGITKGRVAQIREYAGIERRHKARREECAISNVKSEK